MPETREQLVAEIARAVSEFQDATDEVDEAAAVVLGVNRTDLRCLGVLGRGGPLTAGQLAAEVGLSSGAATTAVDRLVGEGLVERVPDERDRRRISVTLTPAAVSRIERLWGPIGEESGRWLRRRSRAELQVIHDFLREGVALQTEHAARIRRENPTSR